jgi:hypothetical protein
MFDVDWQQDLKHLRYAFFIKLNIQEAVSVFKLFDYLNMESNNQAIFFLTKKKLFLFSQTNSEKILTNQMRTSNNYGRCRKCGSCAASAISIFSGKVDNKD